MGMITGIGVLDASPPPVPRIRLWDCGVTWRDLNPAKGVYVWDRLDAMAASGKCLLVLGTTPQWAAKHPDSSTAASWLGPGSNSPPRLLTDWDAYVRHVVARYGASIDYQIWNEPQSQPFWDPWKDIRRLAVMTRRAHAIIKRAAPRARVVSAPVLPRPSSGGLRRGSVYLNALKAEGWPVDVFSFHAYPEEGATPSRYTWMVREVKAALRGLGAPTKPLWCTEVNYNLKCGPIPEQTVPAFLRSTTARSETAGVSRVYWYAYPGHSDPNLLGIPFTPTSVGTSVLRSL